MAVAANKRSVMTLFSGPTDIYSLPDFEDVVVRGFWKC